MTHAEDTARVLADLGERQLVDRIRSIIHQTTGTQPPLDDAAPLAAHTQPSTIWTTTDPSPVPSLVQAIGLGTFFHAGWLCVARSLSDLAAIGAAPLGVLLAVDFPSNTLVDDFERFFQGASACTHAHSTTIIGGNIRESSTCNAVSFAAGYTESPAALLRGPVRAGCVVCVLNFNDLGAYWAGIASHTHAHLCAGLPPETIQRARDAALQPRVKLAASRLLLRHGPPAFTMDNSDGLMGCLAELATRHSIDLVLTTAVSPASAEAGLICAACGGDSWMWTLGWGDCQLLCVLDPAMATRLDDELSQLGGSLAIIGSLQTGPGRILVDDGRSVRPLNAPPWLTGEQFCRGPTLRDKLALYVEAMMSRHLETFCDAS